MDDDFISYSLFTFVGGFVLYLIIGAVVREPGRHLRYKFIKLGKLKGMHVATILAAVGPPNAISTLGDGRTLRQWISTGFHISLAFTGNICDGVTHEYHA